MLQKKNENHHQMIELMQCNCARVQKAANSSCSAISMHACRRQLIVRHYSRSQGCTLRLRYGYAMATLRLRYGLPNSSRWQVTVSAQ